MKIDDILKEAGDEPVYVMHKSWQSGAYLCVTRNDVQAHTPRGSSLLYSDLQRPYTRKDLSGDGWVFAMQPIRGKIK